MSSLKEKLQDKVENICQPNIALAIKNDVQEYNLGNQITSQNENTRLPSIVPDFAISLNEAKQRIEMLQKFVKELMIPDVDFGVIPGCKKPSLYKAGAEKLCDIFGFSKQIEVLNRIEDWEKGVFHYEIKAVLINKRTGFIEAEGLGSCNSKEKKYKDLGGFNIINTVLKMAKKRALIDAVLSATRSSGLFTQDIEDIIDPNTNTNTDINQNSKINDSSQIPYIQNNNTTNNPVQTNVDTKLATAKQITLMQSIVSEKRIHNNTVKVIMKQRYNVNFSRSLTCKQADDFIKFLNNYKP